MVSPHCQANTLPINGDPPLLLPRPLVKDCILREFIIQALRRELEEEETRIESRRTRLQTPGLPLHDSALLPDPANTFFASVTTDQARLFIRFPSALCHGAVASQFLHLLLNPWFGRQCRGWALSVTSNFFFLSFSHLADALIQSDLQ